MVNLSERRRFLKIMLGIGAIALIGSVGGSKLSELLASNEGGTKRVDAVGSMVCGPDREYPPNVNVDNYRLMVDGLVNNPLSLSLKDIMQMESTSLRDTIQCVSDSFFLKANVEWRGGTSSKHTEAGEAP